MGSLRLFKYCCALSCTFLQGNKSLPTGIASAELTKNIIYDLSTHIFHFYDDKLIHYNENGDIPSILLSSRNTKEKRTETKMNKCAGFSDISIYVKCVFGFAQRNCYECLISLFIWSSFARQFQ